MFNVLPIPSRRRRRGPVKDGQVADVLSSRSKYGLLAIKKICQSGLAEEMGVRFVIPAHPNNVSAKIPSYWRLRGKGKNSEKFRRVKGKVKLSKLFRERFFALPTWIREAKLKEKNFFEELKASFSFGKVTRVGVGEVSYRKSFVATIWQPIEDILLAACVVREVPIYQRCGHDKDGNRCGVDPLPVWEIWLMSQRNDGQDDDESILFKLIQALAKAAKIEGICVLAAPQNCEWWLSQTPMTGCSICKQILYKYDEYKFLNESGSRLMTQLLRKFQLRQKPSTVIKPFYHYHDSKGLAEFAPYRFRPYDMAHIWYFTRILSPAQGISAGGEEEWLEIESAKKKVDRSWMGHAGVGTKGKTRMMAGGYTTNGFGGSGKNCEDNYVGGRKGRGDLLTHIQRMNTYGMPDDERFTQAGARHRGSGTRDERINSMTSNVGWKAHHENQKLVTSRERYHNHAKRNKYDNEIEDLGMSGFVTDQTLTRMEEERIKSIGIIKGSSALSRGQLGGGYIVEFDEHLVVDTTLSKVKRKKKKKKKKKRRRKESSNFYYENFGKSVDVFNAANASATRTEYEYRKGTSWIEGNVKEKEKLKLPAINERKKKKKRTKKKKITFLLPHEEDKNKIIHPPYPPPSPKMRIESSPEIRGRKRRAAGNSFAGSSSVYMRGGNYGSSRNYYY
eukprot:g2127.t1